MESSKNLPPPSPQIIATPAPILSPNEALEMRVRAAERAHDIETEFGATANTAAAKNAEEALKAAILINGGSSVAMLAFIGTLVSRDVLSSEQLANITKPLLCFGSGVAASIVASAAAYFTNLFIAGASNRRQREYEHPFLRNTPSSARSVGIGLNQAGIDCKAFATNQTGRNARLDDPLEHTTENISLAAALVAGPRKCRMIRDSILDTELAEPAIGQVHLHFTADQPFRADRKDISHDQHPDHQFRIDRRPAHGRIMRCKFGTKPGQIESSVNPAHQMIFRHCTPRRNS
jgi:hypothetical protein